MGRDVPLGFANAGLYKHKMLHLKKKNALLLLPVVRENVTSTVSTVTVFFFFLHWCAISHI